MLTAAAVVVAASVILFDPFMDARYLELFDCLRTYPFTSFTELLFADRFHPVFYLVAVIIRAGFHPACHAGDLCVRSPAVQFGMAAAEYAG